MNFYKTINNIIFLVTVFIIVLTKTANSIETQWQGINEAQVKLVLPLTSTNNQKIVQVGLLYKLQDGWKTYWKSPGKGGFPQDIDYSKSENIQKIEILWPTPKAFSILGLKSLGYAEEVLFPINIELVDESEPVKVNFDINFLTCKHICVPGFVNLNLLIPNGRNAFVTKYSHLIEKYISQTPLKNFNHLDINIEEAILYHENNNFLLDININSSKPFKNPKIFVDNNFELPIVEPLLSFNTSKKIMNAKLYYENIDINFDDLELNINLKDDQLIIEEKINYKVLNKKINLIFNYNYLQILLIAFVGGLILNAMPCVLPVLSIKFLSAIKYSNKTTSTIRLGFIYSSFGIISTFVFLSLFLILLKYSGNQIGWGMQFQQPTFLMIMSIIILLFSFNLLDLFFIRLPSFLTNFKFLNNNQDKFFSDFFNGSLATILATPCTAPFIATAITFAFSQSNLTMITIFLFMGIGMSSPYIVVAIFPYLIKFLPGPGPWMVWLKRFMAFLLLLTLIWISNILLSHFKYNFFIFSSIIAFSIFLILFIHSKKIFLIKYNIFFILILTTIYFIGPLIIDFKKVSLKTNNEFVDFDEVIISETIDNKGIVFVDITADWCVTCIYNKQNVINTEEIQNLFYENNVFQVKGDWTLPDDNIRKFLNRYNKFGIPFNILYSSNFPEGIILPEILSKSDIKDALKKIKND